MDQLKETELKQKSLSRKEILFHFSYDKKYGKIRWKACLNKNKKYLIGKPLCINKRGYEIVSIKGKQFKVHRIVWFLEKGFWPKVIDHINGIKTDNRIKNLRDVSNRENNQNKKSHREGRLVGSWKSKGKWASGIFVNKKIVHLGYFKTELEAHKAYMQKIRQLKRLKNDTRNAT